MNTNYKNKTKNTTLEKLVIKWLDLNNTTHNILAMAQNNIKIEHAISNMLPKNLELSYKTIKLDNGILSIAVPNSAHATRIRHFSVEIIKKFKELYNLDIKSLNTKIYSEIFNTQKNIEKDYKKSFLDNYSIENFKKLNKKIKDGPLKEAILRLIERNRQ
ncbi:hypothetical protein CDSE_0872 [Candidatus Kinetoplastibacterium desouzaii TCC079E]|uniref:DUF721 domain-containing protein n=1 Tax=Candidatus Kinetoplastidibacterium desouzai TCC079E TaxID=1208919 RepID=M1LSM0_9PROT|nr:DciA family protein [Candidatus Kinetoplastibacterium desouzaii]AGF47116.1 hypothetical protein CDSE_0872 [Candidatus Kinetoplastibacterium desouzaii TCC079E]